MMDVLNEVMQWLIILYATTIANGALRKKEGR